eukprot:747185-Hanusia_phi.AAC.1
MGGGITRAGGSRVQVCSEVQFIPISHCHSDPLEGPRKGGVGCAGVLGGANPASEQGQCGRESIPDSARFVATEANQGQ